jgi:hypothetical protein
MSRNEKRYWAAAWKAIGKAKETCAEYRVDERLNKFRKKREKVDLKPGVEQCIAAWK